MSEDLIRRSDAIEAIEVVDWYHQNRNKDMVSGANSDEHQAWYKAEDVYKALEEVPSADRPQGEWIEVKWHEITDEEREKEGYPKDWIIYMDCQMPADEERILIQTRWGMIELDEAQIDGEMYLDSGYSWVDDVVAWMPLPKPWKGADDE